MCPDYLHVTADPDRNNYPVMQNFPVEYGNVEFYTLASVISETVQAMRLHVALLSIC